ncbi:MAG: PorP/SprF family type IX secretion system membrane protein [Bacteroidetes bacterium]|nr:PorP/SprF family type IX secretion system membrane protein [Bacteroidota bacterium]
MRNLVKIILIFSVFFSNKAFSQQNPLFGFTPFFLNVSNPSVSKTVNPLNITLAGRKYWTGINGSPEAMIGSFTLSPESHKSAFGGFFWQEKAPFIKKSTLGLNYAYSLKDAGEENNLRLGLGLDFSSISTNTSEVLPNDYNDPFYTSLFGNYKSTVDLRTGLSFVNSKVDIGIALQNILNSKNNMGEALSGSMEFKNRFSVNGYLKYYISNTEDFKIAPLIYWQAQKSMPFRIDINLLAEKTGKLWGGLMLRPGSSFSVSAGVWALQDVKVGYLYEKAFLKSMSSKGNSHEILITYTPNLKSKKNEETKPEIKEKTEPKMPKVVRVRDTLVVIKEVRIKEKEEPKKEIEEREPHKTEPDFTKPNDTKKTAPKPTEKIETDKRFYAVAGAFSMETNANNYVAKLNKLGYEAFVVKDNVKNQFNVAIGKFSTREEARSYIAEHGNSEFIFWVKEILP